MDETFACVFFLLGLIANAAAGVWFANNGDYLASHAASLICGMLAIKIYGYFK